MPNVSICEDETNVVHYNPWHEPVQPNDEIWYTTTDGNIVSPSQWYEGPSVVMNTFDGTKFIMKFETPIEDITELFDESDGYLQTVMLPEGLKIIGSYAFFNCPSLISVNIPSTVTSIGNGFNQCPSLLSIIIPSSVETIATLYYRCDNLETIVVNSNNNIYDSRNNCNAIIETNTNTLIQGCKNTIIPDSVTSIGDSAFSYCNSLTSVTIGNSVTSIGNNAFQDCSGLTSITFPSTITTITNHLLYGCNSLTAITFLAEIPQQFDGGYPFDNTNDCPIYVPSSSVEAYKATRGWKDYANRIQAIPE